MHRYKYSLIFIQLCKFLSKNNLHSLISSILSSPIKVFFHKNIIVDKWSAIHSSGADNYYSRFIVQIRDYLFGQIIYSQNISSIVAFYSIFIQFVLVIHATCIMHKYVNFSNFCLYFLSNFIQIPFAPNLTQYQIDLFVIAFFFYLFDSLFTSLRVTTYNKNLCFFVRCENSCCQSQSTISTCDNIIQIFKRALEWRERFVRFGKVGISFEEKLYSTNSFHLFKFDYILRIYSGFKSNFLIEDQNFKNSSKIIQQILFDLFTSLIISRQQNQVRVSLQIQIINELLAYLSQSLFQTNKSLPFHSFRIKAFSFSSLSKIKQQYQIHNKNILQTMLNFLLNRSDEASSSITGINRKPAITYGVSAESPSQFVNAYTTLSNDTYINPHLRYDELRLSKMTKNQQNRLSDLWTKKTNINLVQEQKVINNPNNQKNRSLYHDMYKQELSKGPSRFRLTKGEFTIFLHNQRKNEIFGPLDGQQRTLEKAKQTRKSILQESINSLEKLKSNPSLLSTHQTSRVWLQKRKVRKSRENFYNDMKISFQNRRYKKSPQFLLPKVAKTSLKKNLHRPTQIESQLEQYFVNHFHTVDSNMNTTRK